MNAKEKYFKLLYNTQIPSFCQEGDTSSQKRISELSVLQKAALPKHLYRFRSFDQNGYSVDALKKDEIWGTSANLFNDPLDTQMFFSPDKIKKQYLKMCSDVKKLEAHMLETKTFLNGNEMSDEHYQLIANRKRLASEDELRELVDASCSDILSDIKTQSYIACFTENLFSTLMWAHYADSHSGFAIEYRAIDLFPRVLPVRYSTERVDASDLVSCALAYKLSDINHIHVELKDMLLPTKILTNKTMDWQYEKEWRIFKQDPPVLDFGGKYSGGHQKILNQVPSAVYLGYRINVMNEKMICDIAKEKNIPVYKMVYDTTQLKSTGLELKRIL